MQHAALCCPVQPGHRPGRFAVPCPDMTAIWSGTWFPKRPGIKPTRRITFRNATPASGSAPERVHYKLLRAAPLNAKPDILRDDQPHDRP